MKHFIFTLIILANCTTLLAQSTESVTHKQRLIEFVNSGDFIKAEEEIGHVENWEFDGGDERDFLDIDQALDFYIYIDSIQIDSLALDSFLVYMSKECDVYMQYYYGNGDYSNAIISAEIICMIYEFVYGEQHPDYAASLNNLGILYSHMGDYSKAETYYLQALEISKSILGEQHPDYAASLNNLGNLYADMGDYSKAETYYLQSLEISKSVFGERHPDYAASLNNLGTLYADMGDYSKAETYYLQALEINKTVLGEQHPDYAMSLNNLGVLYSHMGDYSKAETYYLQALEINKTVLGEQHSDYAASLNNIGNLYADMGDYLKAETYYLQALEIRKSVLGEQHPEYARLLNHLGALYDILGDYSKAETYYLQALEIRKSVLGVQHPDYAGSLNNLGGLYREIGDFSKSETYYLQALEIEKSVYGEQHPDYASSLNNLGVLFLNMGDYSRAETYYLQALEIKKTALGEQHPDYASSLNNLGALYMSLGDYSKAETYYLQASRLWKNLFLTSLGFMTEQQRQHYWNTMQTAFAYTYPAFSYLCYATIPSISTFAYDNELFTKGLLLNSSNAITQSIQSSADTALINKFNQLKSTRQMILHLQEKEPQSPHLAEYMEQAETLEKEITKSSAAYRENMRQWSITWDSVRAALKPNQVAIEFMSAPLNEDSTMYCALLLRHNSQHPELIPLFNEKEVASLLHKSTGDTAQINTTYMHGRHGKQLSTLIMGKVLPLIKPGEVLFCSPTGLLHQIAIENLPYDSTRSIGDVYNFVRLSSTRELVLNKPAMAHRNAALYGDIRYNASPAELAVQHEKYKEQEQKEDVSLAKVGRSADRGFAKDLPGTRAEIEAIRPILEGKHIRVLTFSSYAANEESFKALSGTGQNILHVATHGFFWQDSTAQKERFFSQRMTTMSDDHYAVKIDPLERCGLLFAGANTALAGHSNRLDKGVQDGILTAKEISTMDFRNADIVVLSACETGLGDISGEGVFGLQRAFKMAGAKTILMTLWRVDDDATRILMSAFYRNYYEGQTKREAFHNAQREVRNYTVEANTVTTVEMVTTQPYQSPYYWAGFILLD